MTVKFPTEAWWTTGTRVGYRDTITLGEYSGVILESNPRSSVMVWVLWDKPQGTGQPTEHWVGNLRKLPK